MIVGYRLSHPTNITPSNPFGWSRNFQGRWWDFLEQLRRERISRIYLRGALGSNYNDYLTDDNAGSENAKDLRAFKAAYAEYNGFVLVDPVKLPMIAHDHGHDRGQPEMDSPHYVLFDGLVTRSVIEAYLKGPMTSHCLDVIVPNKFVRNDWPENLATWDSDVNFIGRTKGISE